MCRSPLLRLVSWLQQPVQFSNLSTEFQTKMDAPKLALLLSILLYTTLPFHQKQRSQQPQDLLLNISECREGIETLLTQFNTMFQSNQNGSNAMGSALKAAHKLISPIGGKIVCLMASLPNISTGKLTPRDSAGVAGTSKEAALLQTQNSFYKSFAVECSKHQVSVDMFLFSSLYQDVASLSCLPRYTGGQTYYYPGWNASRSEDAVKFANEFSEVLSMEIALEAVMRIRATSGLYQLIFCSLC